MRGRGRGKDKGEVRETQREWQEAYCYCFGEGTFGCNYGFSTVLQGSLYTQESLLGVLGDYVGCQG